MNSPRLQIVLCKYIQHSFGITASTENAVEMLAKIDHVQSQANVELNKQIWICGTRGLLFSTIIVLSSHCVPDSSVRFYGYAVGGFGLLISTALMLSALGVQC